MARVWPLVGRAEELRLINAAVTGADGYRGIVIAGSAGVGKSRLALESISQISPGRWLPRWARATASARVLPLGAFAEWTGDNVHDPLLVVRGVIDRLTTAPQGAEIIVGVDDAHLLDDQSAFVIHQLVQRRLAKVILTIRAGEPAPDAVTALWKDGLLQRVELQPLSEEETRDLLTTVLAGRLQTTAARQLWNLTRGNALYLRHLVEQELVSGRLTQNKNAWVWTGQPVVSPGLADLIDTQIGGLPNAAGAVLDFLTIGEPLAEQMLIDLTGPDAVEATHAAGLITIEHHGRNQVRLAHPLYGEARSAQATPLRLRRMRSKLATALSNEPDAGPRDLVRRAVLTLGSDLPQDPVFFTKAATAALSLFDADLAERLAAAAIANGGGYDAQFLRASALTNLGRGLEAEELLAELLTTHALVDEQIVDTASLRAINLLLVLNRPANAESVLADALAATSPDMHASLTAVLAIVLAYQGHPLDAVNAANRALRTVNLTDVAATWGAASLFIALGDLGRSDEIAPIAARAYDQLANPSRTSNLRIFLYGFHARSLYLAGYIGKAEEITVCIRGEAADHPASVQQMTGLLIGLAALAAGRLHDALRWLEQPGTLNPEITGSAPTKWACALAEAQAQAGNATAAARTLRVRDSLCSKAVPYLESNLMIFR